MIREATVHDAARTAEIDAVSSRYAYQSILPDECLKDLSAENRVPVHTRWIAEKRFGIFVYEDDDTGIIKGMMGIGMCEDDDKKGAFELHFLYIDPVYVRMGIGSEMLRFFEHKGEEKGCREYVVWVLEENRMGRNFYEKNKYAADGKEKIFQRWRKREIRYVKSAVQYAGSHNRQEEHELPKLLLRPVTEDDLPEVARTWPSDHRPVSEEEARGAISYMRDSHAKNTKGCIFHLCLAVCRAEEPGTIMGWCGLDGRRNHTEPEIFILLDEEYHNKGYGTQCVKELLRMAAEDFALHSVHGGCDKDNTASRRIMEKGGMVQYGTEDNGDPLFRFTAKEKE